MIRITAAVLFFLGLSTLAAQTIWQHQGETRFIVMNEYAYPVLIGSSNSVTQLYPGGPGNVLGASGLVVGAGKSARILGKGTPGFNFGVMVTNAVDGSFIGGYSFPSFDYTNQTHLLVISATGEVHPYKTSDWSWLGFEVTPEISLTLSNEVEVVADFPDPRSYYQHASRVVVQNDTDFAMALSGTVTGGYPLDSGTGNYTVIAARSCWKGEVFRSSSVNTLTLRFTNIVTGAGWPSISWSPTVWTNQVPKLVVLAANGTTFWLSISEWAWLGWGSSGAGEPVWTYQDAVDGVGYGLMMSVPVLMFGIVRKGMGSWTGLGG